MKNNKSRQYPLRDTLELMEILLKDRTTNENIKWAVDDYQFFDANLKSDSEIQLEILTNGLRKHVQPRVKKTLDIQKDRTKERAEVFTPTWIVKLQVNLVEKEFQDLSLKKYVDKTWLEITCGEAPYICTRYDMTTGKPIKLNERVGFLDKKLQRINKEIEDKEEWLDFVIKAYKKTYGYEYQGDSLLIARENLLFTFVDYYLDKFNHQPTLEELKEVATIISNNIIQMDGLDYTVPYSEIEVKIKHDLQLNLFNTFEELQQANPNTIMVNQRAKIIFKEKEIYFEELTERGNNMKFDVVIGNPPYQGVGRQQIYTDFYIGSHIIGNISCMIFPTGWLGPKNANNLKKMNNKRIKRDEQIVKIIKLRDAFKNVSGASSTNIVIWKRGYNNLLNGKQLIIEEDGSSSVEIIPIKREEVQKPDFIVELSKIVEQTKGFISFQNIVSKLKPYGLRTDFVKEFSKYNLPPPNDTKIAESDIRLYTPFGFKYVSNNFPFPSFGKAYHKFKVFVPYAWGGFGDEAVGLGGAYSDIFIAQPYDTCIETYLECGSFETREDATKMAKYMMTKFFRALLYVNKYSQHSTTAFGAIPLQSFSEHWWNETVEEINIRLFEKYKIPKEVMLKVNDNIQAKNENNIQFLY